MPLLLLLTLIFPSHSVVGNVQGLDQQAQKRNEDSTADMAAVLAAAEALATLTEGCKASCRKVKDYKERGAQCEVVYLLLTRPGMHQLFLNISNSEIGC